MRLPGIWVRCRCGGRRRMMITTGRPGWSLARPGWEIGMLGFGWIGQRVSCGIGGRAAEAACSENPPYLAARSESTPYLAACSENPPYLSACSENPPYLAVGSENGVWLAGTQLAAGAARSESAPYLVMRRFGWRLRSGWCGRRLGGHDD